jgi:formate hydrogenlyase subunit 3/multisubunit Na+/H+ antiporter MnhD subunit
MNAAVIWIILPGLVALLLLLISRMKWIVVLVGVSFTLFLSALAWWLPIGKLVSLGPLSIEITPSLAIMGRQFILVPSDRPLLVMLYLGAAFWFGGAQFANVDRHFIALSLGITALVAAALFVQPFLYAALIIEMAVLVSVALLASPNQPIGRGVLRFLIFLTLSMPFILFVGWMLGGVEANPGDTTLASQVIVLAAFGFGLLFAIFPFHTWIPMLAEEAHPYTAAFVFYILSLAMPLFGLNFLERYNWLFTSPWLFVFLRLSGVLMVLTGGVGAIFQHHLGRLMGFAMVMEIGNSLLAMSLGIGVAENRASMGILFALLLPRGLGLGVWALSVSIIREHTHGLSFDRLRGEGRHFVISASCLFLALLTLVGFPLTAGFPVHLALLQGLGLQFPLAAYAVILGSIGLLMSGVRVLGILVMGASDQPWQILEKKGQSLLLTLAGMVLIILGIIPQWFYPMLFNMARVFLRIE